MKRIDMIDVLKRALYEITTSKVGQTYYDQAEYILAKLESEGMLPPGYLNHAGNQIFMWEEDYEALHNLESETRHIECECEGCTKFLGSE